jgi:hypothetical protein
MVSALAQHQVAAIGQYDKCQLMQGTTIPPDLEQHLAMQKNDDGLSMCNNQTLTKTQNTNQALS